MTEYKGWSSLPGEPSDRMPNHFTGAVIDPVELLKPNAGHILAEAAETFAERYKVYGDNYKAVGKVMAAFFPEGMILKTPDDWNRMHLFLLTVIKQTRYLAQWTNGGHDDSLLDASVYFAMLLEIDRANRNKS